MRLLALLTFAVCAWGQPPSFHPRDIRPHGAAEPHPLLPGMLVWIFGENLGPPCGVENSMDPRTYKSTLCGVRVLFGGIEAKLLFTGPKQINLIAPDHPWENEPVNVQVVNEDGASAVVPVRFGVNRPVLSLAETAFTGMPVWVHIEEPWGKGWVRYPHWTEPWKLASGRFDVRFAGRELPTLPSLPYRPTASFQMGNVGLPHEPPAACRLPRPRAAAPRLRFRPAGHVRGPLHGDAVEPRRRPDRLPAVRVDPHRNPRVDRRAAARMAARSARIAAHRHGRAPFELPAIAAGGSR